MLVNTILGIQLEFDIILIQELSWITIHSISSLKSKNTKELVDVPNHPNWITFSKVSTTENNSSWVILYINIRISFIQFSLSKDILNHRDISLISFFNNNNIFSLINIYSDSSQPALKHLKNMKATIIYNCNNVSTSGSNKLSWRHLKIIMKDNMCLKRIIDIADACFELGYWPLYFKILTSIIIPKSNKESYNSPKLFRLIVLLNIINKPIEKVIGERLQFQLISNNSIYPSQLGGLEQESIIDVRVALTHFIHSRWVKNVNTSTLAFDIAQFFPSLNH